MSVEPEQAFAEEAREEAILSQTRSHTQEESSSSKKNNAHTNVEETTESSSESSPLLASHSNARRRQPYARASKSYQKAIDEPWTGAHGLGDRPWYKKPSVFWLLPGFFPFCIAVGGIIVPKTYLILDLICKDYFSDRAMKDPSFSYMPVIIGDDNEQCQIPEVQSLNAWFNIYSDLLSGGFAAIVAPFLGALSDRIGRKKVVICTSMGAFVTEIVTIIIGRNPDKISVYWLLVGSLIDGLCGSFTTALALTFAYATDCTAPEKRAVAFAYFQATLFSGIALGPIVVGYLIKFTNSILTPFYFGLGCHLFFILFTLFFVPESLSQERQVIAREKHEQRKKEFFGQPWTQTMKRYNIFEPLWVLRPKGEGSSPALRRNIIVLAAIDTMMFGVAMGTLRILLAFARYRYDWNAVEASWFMTACNVVRVSGLIGLLPLLTWLFRNNSSTEVGGHRGSDKLDLNIIKVAVVFDLIGYLGYALAPTGTFMFLAGIIAAIGGIGSPTLSSSLTKHLPASMTGQVLGASGLLHALARVVAPVVFNFIYSRTVKFYPGFVFLTLASIFVIVFVMSWFLRTHVYLHDQSSADQEQEEEQEQGPNQGSENSASNVR